jgi:hypothetical protein
MDEEIKIDDQVQKDESQEGQSDNQNEGEANDTSKVKIGEVEYTPEQLAEIVKKGSQYDELLPDYTRKSQKLSDYEKNIKSNEQPKTEVPYLDDNWEPKTYKELRDAILWARDNGKEEALQALQAKESEAQQVKQQVEEFVTETKKTDKNFNEKDFFSYVLRHNFPAESVENLKSAYSTYKELSEAKKLGANEAMKQGDDKVNKGNNSGDSKLNFNDLRSSGKDMYSSVMEALKRVK